MNIFLSFKEWFHILENNSQDQLQLDVLKHPKYAGNKFDVLVVKDSPSKKNKVYSVSNDLKKLGFRWDFPIKLHWQLIREDGSKDYVAWGSLNLEDMKHLEDLNIDTSLLRKELGLPQIPKDPIAQQIGNVDIASNETTKFYLATSKFLRSVPEGEPVVVYSDKDNWVYEDRYGNSGVIASSQIGNMIKRVTDKNGKPISGNNVKDLFEMFDEKFLEKKPQQISKVNVASNETDLCKKVFSDPEKKKIDDAFANIVKSGRKGHVVVNALAGSGKTTTLKCLWEKYGRGTGQKWLYLVFNKKNREEAKKKFIGLEYEIYTTNAFLNKVLKNNPQIVPPTQYAIGSGKDKIEVARDSKDYIIFRNGTSLPSVDQAKNAFKNMNNRYIKSGIYFIDRQENVIDDCAQKLGDLVKQYGTDPNDDKALTEKLDDVMEKFDITQDLVYHLEFFKRMKSHMSGDSLRSLEQVEDVVESIDIKLNEKKEIIKLLAKWLLEKTSPGNKTLSNNQNKFKKDDKDYDFHQLRDFNDDFWYAGIYADKIKWPKYDVILADEVQDFNYMQKVMLQKLADNGSSVVAVGDPNQALYRFRGAENTSFHDLVDTLQKDHLKTNPNDGNIVHDVVQEMPSNYRSRQNIIDFVNSDTKVKNLKRGRDYSKDNPDYHGEVTDKEIKIEEIGSHIGDNMKNGRLDKSTALLARTNAPLVQASMELLKKGIPFTVIGRNFASEMVSYFKNLIRELGFDDYTPVDILIDKEDESGKLSNFLNAQKEKFSKQATKKSYLKELQENINAILSICYIAKEKDPNIKNVDGVVKWIGKLFKNNTKNEDDVDGEDLDHVVLTTVHKSKGFEFDRVYLLDPSNFPHPRAKLEADLDQEENAKYVAYTRAKDELHIIDDRPK